MKYEIKNEGGSTVLHLFTELTLADRDEFERIVPQVISGTQSVTVDMQGLTYMDSAGLGMLLTLKEKADPSGASISIRNAEGEVKELLDLACFDTLFSIV